MTIYEWDEAKNKKNRVKHGIDFETGQMVFDDPFFVEFIGRIQDGEERWRTIGMVQTVAIIVVHTYRDEGSDEVVRIISCRRASRHERRLYEETRR